MIRHRWDGNAWNGTNVANIGVVKYGGNGFGTRCFRWGVAVPIFALLSAGVTVGGLSGLGTALRNPVTLGIMAALVAGKVIGIVAETWLIARFTKARLDEGLAWIDVLGLALLGGIGFTVSLLIGELAFGIGSSLDDRDRCGPAPRGLPPGASNWATS